VTGLSKHFNAHVNDPVLGFREALLLALLGAEVLGISLRFDPWLLANNPNWSGLLFVHVPELLKIGVAFTGGLLIVLGPRLKGLARELHQSSHQHWWVWLLFHSLSFSAFILINTHITNISADSFDLPAAWGVGWLALVGTTFVFWLLALAPARFWGQLIRRESIAFAVASLAGVAAWAGGLLAQKLWQPLAETTFWLTHLLLDPFYTTMISDADERILGTPAFQVHIAPDCSGYEGMAMIVVYVAIYVWLFRKNLRFPAALLLFPLGMLAIYLANAVRLAALISLGTHYSPEVAVSGFHSQAGWITFTVIAVGVIALAHRTQFFARTKAALPVANKSHLATALLAPLLVLMAAAMITTAFSSGFDALYPLRVVVTAAALWYFRAAYCGLGWSWSWQAVAIGIAVFAVWMMLEPVSDNITTDVEIGLGGLPQWVAGIWIFFHVIGSVITVPLAEELVFRGYLIRKLIARDFETIPLGQFTWFSFLLSSVLFGLLHGRWVAGILAGMGFAFALYRRGRLGDAVAAHMTANALIAAYVLVYQRWSLWA
jgi:exosortase E/protease (VPEID-CTERM system)